MKKQSLFITIAVLFCHFSYSQNWQWAKQVGGPELDRGGIRLDSDDNIYCSGSFHNECYFETDTLRSRGFNDLFLAKYNATGEELWTRSFGGDNPANLDESGGIEKIDNVNMCIYYAGEFFYEMNIDGHLITSKGGMDLFLAKFDFNGNCLWLHSAGSNFDEYLSSMAFDSSGNVYWAGDLANNGSFATNNLNKGTFLSKIDINGNIIWARNEITGGDVSDLKIFNNSLFIIGVAFNDTTRIDTQDLISQHGGGMILAQLDLNGNYIKAKKYDSRLAVILQSFEIDENNNIYAAGEFIDSLFINGDTLTNSGRPDFIFAKFDSSFNIIWYKQSFATGPAGSNIGSMKMDSQGNIYVCGLFSGNATFGSFSINSSVSSDMFVALYTPNGDCIGVNHFGEAGSGLVNIDSNGDLFVSGYFFNTINVGSSTLTSYGGSLDIFFAKSAPITNVSENERSIINILKIYANPNNGICNVTIPNEFKHEKKLLLSIFNQNGKLMQQTYVLINSNDIRINLEEEAKGIYDISLSNGKRNYSGKIVFE